MHTITIAVVVVPTADGTGMRFLAQNDTRAFPKRKYGASLRFEENVIQYAREV
jgi:hypothetical protein